MTEKDQKIAVYALTRTGAETARRIAAGLWRAELFLPARLAETGRGEKGFNRISATIRRNFADFSGHVVVAASGIVIRAIAPMIKDKTVDPGVVVVDQEGRFAISLLSGHLGGANRLAEKTAEILGGQAVITTGTDAAGKPSLEVLARDCGLKVENLKALSRLSRMILEGDPVKIYDPWAWLAPSLESWPGTFEFLDRAPAPDRKEPLVWVGHEALPFPPSWLVIRPLSLVVGLGCNRGTSAEEMAGLIEHVFDRESLAVSSVGCLASIEAKSDEPGLLALAERLGVEMVFFSPDQLKGTKTPTPSVMVEKHMGVKSVCEAAAQLAARTDRLLVKKHKSLNATLAVALIESTS